MKLDNVKAYSMVLSSGLVILAAVILVALQWGNQTDVTMYGPSVEVNTALLMVCSGVGGVLFLLVAILMYRGIRLLRRIRTAAKQAAKPDVTS